jgi:CRISPR-associated protein Csm4
MLSKRFATYAKRSDLRIFKSAIAQRVTLPKMWEIKESMPFYMQKLYFADNAGLFCMVEIKDDNADTLQRLKAMFKLLGENGIGSDRAVGCGQFDVSYHTLTLALPATATKFTNLGLYCPTDTNEVSNPTAFTLIKRGGWLASPENETHLTYRKKSIYMVEEGAVFGFDTNSFLMGKSVNLQPDEVPVKHDIWRDGRALWLPIVV